MKEGLKLKIGNHWCVLKEDTSISIEMTSPLWNESGSFSYPFTIPYDANRFIFNAAELPESDVNLKTFRERFELYVDGFGLLFGDAVCTSDEIDLDDDSIELELRSKVRSLNDSISEKSLRDLDMSDVVLGYMNKKDSNTYPKIVKSKNYMVAHTESSEFYLRQFTDETGFSGFMQLGNWSGYTNNRNQDGYEETIQQPINDNSIYPDSKYINIPISVQAKDEDGNLTFPYILSANRAMSSPCFFLLELLSRTFRLAEMQVDISPLVQIEDMCRMILISTSFKYTEKNAKTYVTKNKSYKINVYKTTSSSSTVPWEYSVRATSTDCTLVPSAELLPSIPLSDFVDIYRKAFGVRFIYDEKHNNMRTVILRDVFRSNYVTRLFPKEIYSINPIHEDFTGIEVKYGNDSSTEFKYEDYSNPKLFASYDEILIDLSVKRNMTDSSNRPFLESDTMLRISGETGNMYRIKVDREKFDSPELFEVGQFNSYKVDGFNNIEKTEPEEITLPFTPIIPTVVNREGKNKFLQFKEFEMPDESVFVSAQIDLKGRDYKKVEFIESDKIGDSIEYDGQTAKDYFNDILEADLGDMVGIVRTKAIDNPDGKNYSITEINADKFGNDAWTSTVSADSITSDSVTHRGELYDYNGSGEGIGAPLDEIISLKIWSGKQNFNPSALTDTDSDGNVVTGKDVYDNNPTGSLPNRGLVPQFLSEYIHFLKHRKTLEITASMEAAEIADIQWESYYEIAGYRCFIDKISFSADANGMGIVTFRVYCI